MTEKLSPEIMPAAAQMALSHPQPAPNNPGLWESIRAPVIVGSIIVIAFFGVFGGWATLAPLDSAAVTSGVVSVEGNRKTVQHLEGGIIGEILVKAGDKVSIGQALIRLDDTLPKANLELLQGRLNSAIALEARLKAESEGRQKIVFPESITKKLDQPKVLEIITGQTNIFEARKDAVTGKINILNRRIAQLSEEVIGLNGQIKAEDTQIDLINQEISDISGLVEKGLAPRPRLLSLQRRLAEIEGTKSQHRADIARSRQSMAETRLQISELHTEMVNESVQQLRDTQNEQRPRNSFGPPGRCGSNYRGHNSGCQLANRCTAELELRPMACRTFRSGEGRPRLEAGGGRALLR